MSGLPSSQYPGMPGSIGGGYGAQSGSGTQTSSGTTTTTGNTTGSNKSSQTIAPMSATETNLTGGLSALGGSTNPYTSSGLGAMLGMFNSGMQPTAKQKSGLQSIAQSQLASDQQGINYSLFGPGGWMNQVNNQMADRGMTNSSVDSMANQGVLQNAQNLMNQDVQGINTNYQQGMLSLPYQNANMLSGLANLGLSAQGTRAGISQGLLSLLTGRDMANASQTGSSNQNTNQNQQYNNTTSYNNNANNWNLVGAITGGL